jgi:CheY-like chemotaxis protein
MRVLLVDDDPGFLDTLARILEGETGLLVVGRARSAEEAIVQSANLLPDVVVMDVEMPGIDGLETARRLRARPDAPRVVLVSICGNDAHRLAAQAAGADAFLSKSELPWTLVGTLWEMDEAAAQTGEAGRERACAGAGPATPPAIRARVLIVHDNPDMATLLAEMLVDAGYQVQTATSARAALHRVDAEPFDLILSDVRMPQMDGPAFYRDLAERHPELARRVIFVTGDLLTTDAAKFLVQSGVPSLGKPFTLYELNDTVRRVLARPAGPARLRCAACDQER